jgi:hypothetical protein
MTDTTKPIHEGVPKGMLAYLENWPSDARIKVFMGMGFSNEAIIAYETNPSLHPKPGPPSG